MTNHVKDWMSSPVIVVDPDSTVSFALTLMRRRNIHSLVVDLQAEEDAYGIITSTDIRDKIILADRNPAETSVREIMTSPVVTAREVWTLKKCSAMMQEKGIRHLPVCDRRDNLIGMISDTDIFMAAEEIGWLEEP